MAPRRRSQPGKSLPQTTTFSIETIQDLAFGWEPWTPQALEELLPELSVEEQLRVHSYLRKYQRHGKEFRTPCPHAEWYVRPNTYSFKSCCMNMDSACKICRKTKKIKRFFAEVHYKPPIISFVRSPPVPGAPSSSSVRSHLSRLVMMPVVEACTIIEEPLDGNRKSCAFCSGHLDILHPKGRKFVCGNDKDRIVQRIEPCGGSPMGFKMPFTC